MSSTGHISSAKVCHNDWDPGLLQDDVAIANLQRGFGDPFALPVLLWNVIDCLPMRSQIADETAIEILKTGIDSS